MARPLFWMIFVRNGPKLKPEGSRMGYAAVVLAILGFGVGLAFRLKVLLMILALLLVFSVVIAIAQGFDLVHTAVTIIETQTSTQVGYFLGVVARSIFHSVRRMHPII
jgi:hypothetical protein